MNPEEVYLSWAPPESVWSPWAIPVPFAQIVCVPLELERELAGIDFLAHGGITGLLAVGHLVAAEQTL